MLGVMYTTTLFTFLGNYVKGRMCQSATGVYVLIAVDRKGLPD